MTKDCTTMLVCKYHRIENGMYSCHYGGYCDYQLPRDSRMQPITPSPYIPPNLGAESHCPYCHLPLSQCRGHTIY